MPTWTVEAPAAGGKQNLVFKIVAHLATRWRVLNGGATVMALVLAGERFVDGVRVRKPPREEERAA